MKTTSRHALGVSFAMLALCACGGGSGGGSSSVLKGTWYGSGLDLINNPNGMVMRVVVEDGNKITEVEVDGVNQQVTGSLARVQSQIYEFSLDDGTLGGIAFDDTLEHGFLITDTMTFAVLERGAVGLPAYQVADVYDMNLEGLTITVDASFDLDEVLDTQMQVFVDGTFSGFTSSGWNITNKPGNFLDFGSQVFGIWVSDYTANTPGGVSTGQTGWFLSCDGSFVGALIMDDTAAALDEWAFGAWSVK